jgi:hypothetical protein
MAIRYELSQFFVMSESSNMLIAQRFFPRRWWGKQAAEGTGGGKGIHFASFGWCLWHVTKDTRIFSAVARPALATEHPTEESASQVAEHSEEKEQLD